MGEGNKVTEPEEDLKTSQKAMMEELLNELFKSALGDCFKKDLLTNEVITKASRNKEIQEITAQYIGYVSAKLKPYLNNEQCLLDTWLTEAKRKKANNNRSVLEKCSHCGSSTQPGKRNKSADETAFVRDADRSMKTDNNDTLNSGMSKNNISDNDLKAKDPHHDLAVNLANQPATDALPKHPVSKESANPIHNSKLAPASDKPSEIRPGTVPPPNTPPIKITPPLKISFYLPNAKVGVEYREKIVIDGNSDKEIHIKDVIIPNDLGIKFDAKDQAVSGTPQKSGEFSCTIQWQAIGDEHSTGATCQLVVNPDPRTLWKVIEPDSSLPYHKAHTDEVFIEVNGYKLAAASRRGRSHEHQGSFRDDDFFVKNLNDKWSVLIVADGAGSAVNSREGSRIAVETAGQLLGKKIEDELGQEIEALLNSWDDAATQKMISDKFYYCFYDVAKNAIQEIENEANKNNSPTKDYSTTLLIALVKREKEKTFLATFWMGDGAIAAYNPNGVLKLMGSPDSGEYAGQTRFLDKNALADKDFIKRIGIGYYSDISAVILMTDGVSDPYFETDNALADKAKWDTLWNDFSPELNNPQPEKSLVEWLHFFKPGHHDDRTIALLW